VLCNGSFNIKSGMANPFSPPTTIVASDIGIQTVTTEGGTTDKKYYVGSEIKNQQDLVFANPFKDGCIQDWDAAEALWSYILYTELGYERSRFIPILATEPLMTSKNDRSTFVQMFFESFETPGFFLAEQSLMSLYGVGAQTGLVVDIGHEKTDIIPIFDNVLDKGRSQTIPIGGRKIEEQLMKMLSNDQPFLDQLREKNRSLDLNFIRAVKNEALEAAISDLLPEPKVVTHHENLYTIGNVRSRCIETLFDPRGYGTTSLGVTEAIQSVLYNFDPERKKALIENILITGGCSAINGIQKRMEKELLGALASSDQIITEAGASGIKLLEVPKYIENLHKKQHYADWLGASITAKLVFPQQQMYITRADYNEFGPNIIHVKVPG